MSPLLTVAVLAALSQEPTEQLLSAAVNHINSHKLDSAAIVLRRVGGDSTRLVVDRVKAWVLLGVVDYYRSGDSAAAEALRHALRLDPELQAPGVATNYPDVARILEIERFALSGRRPPPDTAPTRDPLPAVLVDTVVYNCTVKCPGDVLPPYFVSFPNLGILEGNTGAGSGRNDRRMHSFVLFHAVVDPSGRIRPETLVLQGGTARRMENQLRPALLQSRFEPGRSRGLPASTLVTIRFDFSAEGMTSIRYSYRVTAR